MKLPLLASALVTLGIVAACSSEDERSNATTPPGPDSGKIGDGDGGTTNPDGGKEETDIVFADGTTFAKRDCTLTIRWAGGGTDVKIAGEFTSWATSPLALTKTGSGHEITLSPGPTLEGGKLYAYKIIADGNWTLDPANKYRKLVDGQMNSGLVLPACAAGPETVPGLVALNGAEMKVRATIRSAEDGDAIERVKASLDNVGLPAGSFVIDAAAGAVDFTLLGLGKGKHTLSLRSFDKKGREAEPIDLPFWVEDEAFDYRDGVLYMMLIDRFANGDKANDCLLYTSRCV